jgi:hypothetical protein
VLFKTEKDADAALRAMNGTLLKAGDNSTETKLVISKAASKGKTRLMASKTKKSDFDT